MNRIQFKRMYLWDRLCCFLTDHRYSIAREAGPKTMHQIWKYALGVILVMFLWFFVGYFFTIQYLGLTHRSAIIGGAIMAGVVWFIERMIIHTHIEKIFSAISIFRVMLALLMSVIGSVILDQMMFKADIQQVRQKYIESQIQELIPDRMRLINEHIQQLYLQRQQIDSQIQVVTEEVRKHPTIQLPNYTQTVVRDSAGRIVQRAHTAQFTAQTNPEVNRIPLLYQLRAQVDSSISALESRKQNVADQIREELEHTHGLLTEINAFFYFLSGRNSLPALLIWVMMFVVFVLIELLVLSIKLFDRHTYNMYDELMNWNEQYKRKVLAVPDSFNEPALHPQK